MNISIACPSYKRPESMVRLVESVFETTKEIEKIEVIFYLDDNDFDSHNVAKILMQKFGKIVKAITGPKIKLSNMWNHCAQNTDFEIVMLCADDIIFRTIYWDILVREKFNEFDDKILFVHGDDGHNSDKFGTHGFLHRNWINTVGYFLPPYFSADWCDTWINEVSDKLRRRFYVPILTEHMHFSLNKSELDLTHIERLERGRIDDNQKIYVEKKIERDIDFLKLKNFINEQLINQLITQKVCK